MRFVSVLFISLSVAPILAQTIHVVPPEIQAGEVSTLTWGTGGRHAFVIGYGKKVLGNGMVEVRPAVTTNFTLVTETDTGFKYSTARLLVNNARGDDGFPLLSDFDIGVQGNSASRNYIDFQSYVWAMLQNSGYGVKGDYVPKRPSVTFYTNFALRPDLVSREEKLRGRRLALAIDIFEPRTQGGLIYFVVRARLEFQYRGETNWRVEKDSPLARAEAKKILQSLERAK
jgi:hypothetical protein